MKDSFIGLYNFLIPGINSIPKVFSKNFIKQRYYLHFFVSLILTILSVRLLVVNFHFDDLSFIIKVLVGWMGAYLVNYYREVLLFKIGKAKFDQLDVHAGAYGGIVGTVLYICM